MAIESIRLGQRVQGKNPHRHEVSKPSVINANSWRAIRLTMRQHDVTYQLAFLRSLDWIEAAGAREGGTIRLELAEMGLNGPARVEAIEPCPTIEPDDGTHRMVVSGTMCHLADNILNVYITGLDEPLGVTNTHPIWSETRQDFVVVGQLQVGERLRSETGVVSQVTRITPHRGPPQLTYNLEVDGEHVYQVAGAGLLVHNNCPFAMGIDNHLDDFAADHGATTWKSFKDKENWKSHVLEKLYDKDTPVFFNLDGVDVWNGAQRAASGRGGATDWELLQIMLDPDIPNLHFFKNGVKVENPFK